MASKGTGGKTSRLAGVGAGGPVDLSTYATAYTSEATAAAFQQPFWDIENYDDDGNPLGYSGDLFSQNPWDVVKINGTPLPGVWTVTAVPSLQLDVQKPNGYDGAALVQKGYIPASITITGRIWTPAQWAHFQELIPTFWRKPNKWAVADTKKATAQIVGQQLAVSISHPGIAPFEIGLMVVYQVNPPEDTDQRGVKQIKMLARQYIPAPQKQQSAIKKTNGQAKDRTVQARKILNGTTPGTSGEPGQKKQPEAATAPLKPSVTEIGVRKPRMPNFANR
jgi:hypothetical protein